MSWPGRAVQLIGNIYEYYETHADPGEVLPKTENLKPDSIMDLTTLANARQCLWLLEVRFGIMAIRLKLTWAPAVDG
jgi:hypothetical protein